MLAFLIFLVSTVIDLNSSKMKKNNLTIGIYGIADTARLPYPAFVHDHNLSIFRNGALLQYLHLERITRRKYDNRLDEFLYDLLKSKKITTKPIPTLVFVDHIVGRSFCSFQGDIRFEAPLNETLSTSEETGKIRWLGMEGTGYVISHELAHLFSCIPYYGMFKNNSLLIHFDGGASKSNFSAWKYINGQLELLEYHWDLKWITAFFNANPLSFALTGGNIKNQNSVPGKMMGLAAYGIYRKDIEEWLVQHDYLNDYWGKTRALNDRIKADWNIALEGIHSKSTFLQDVIATMHHIFIRETIDKIVNLHKNTQTEYLYFTGGSALNIALNKELIRLHRFREIYIPPCTNDSGLSVGAGVFMEMKKNHQIELITPYINNWNVEQEDTPVSEHEINSVAEKIHAGAVVGVCNGPAEAGPRALGNRSIISRANDRILANRISMHMKKREWYRPLAPVMLPHQATYFTGLTTFPVMSKYMLTEFDIRPEKRKELEGAVHVNNTARIQIVFREQDNPFLWALLHVLEKKYHIRALLNTSFNQAGEPLVHTREDAVHAARKMNVDMLVINGAPQHF
jgi:carbamoyltransferase